MKTVRRLSKNAWKGSDLSPDISLFEYNLVWKEPGDGKDIIFIHPCSHGKGFTTSTFRANLDVKREFDWVKWDELLSFLGEKDYASWDAARSLPQKISDIMSYHGIENTFGTDYHEGFYVKFI